MKNLLFILLCLFLISFLPFYAMAQDERLPEEEYQIHEETPVFIEALDMEDGKVQLEVDFISRSYKDGRNTYYATPFLLRIDTGHGTELRILSDFLVYQEPRYGINDITIGVKWNFYKGNTNLAILPNVELPVGGGGFPVPEPLPGINFLGDININEKWCVSFNTGWSSQMDGVRQDRYNQGTYLAQVCYSPDSDNQISLGGLVVAPYVLNGDNVTRLYINYSHVINPNFSLSMTVLKGASAVDRNLQIMFGINHSWDISNKVNER